MEPDFSGWATKADLECSDGRTIMKNAFAHQDQITVPLVWSHQHKDVENVLGHVLLTNKPEGVWCDAFFNSATKAQAAKAAVQHGDVKFLSIWANKLKERANSVFHGMIREVSLVLAGANPGATIETIAIQHADGDIEHREDEAIITTGIEITLAHADGDKPAEEKPAEGDKPAEEGEGESEKDIYDSLTEKQKQVVHGMIAVALETTPVTEEGAAEHSATGENAEGTNTEGENLNHQEGTTDVNVFEQNGKGGEATEQERRHLSHDELNEIKENWKRGGSMKQAVEEFALKHGIENLDLLFPDPKLVGEVEFDARRMEWVDGVINGTKKSPMSRIKTMFADITMEAARARGYIKGNLKKEEWFALTKRTTSPTTVYKKQKLDRDDILDATDLNIVAFMKAEMRMMLKEEIARAILIGDGRPVEDPANPGEPNPDKVKDPMGEKDGVGIRSILHDDELYAATHNVVIPAVGASYQPLVETVMLAMNDYKGSGTPTLYTTRTNLTRMLLSKDGMGRRLWRNKAELASELGVDTIVDVEVFDDEPSVFGIIVNLRDYNVGTDAGGEVTLFDDFDLDYNQYKYLIETRFSGALVKIRSAIVIRAAAQGSVEVVPEEPTFDEATGVVTIPVNADVDYFNAETDAPLADGAQPALNPGETLYVQAVAVAGKHFASNQDDQWAFERPVA